MKKEELIHLIEEEFNLPSDLIEHLGDLRVVAAIDQTLDCSCSDFNYKGIEGNPLYAEGKPLISFSIFGFMLLLEELKTSDDIDFLRDDYALTIEGILEVANGKGS